MSRPTGAAVVVAVRLANENLGRCGPESAQHGGEVLGRDLAGQAEFLRTAAEPLSDDPLLFAVIVVVGVLLLVLSLGLGGGQRAFGHYSALLLRSHRGVRCPVRWNRSGSDCLRRESTRNELNLTPPGNARCDFDPSAVESGDAEMPSRRGRRWISEAITTGSVRREDGIEPVTALAVLHPISSRSVSRSPICRAMMLPLGLIHTQQELGRRHRGEHCCLLVAVDSAELSDALEAEDGRQSVLAATVTSVSSFAWRPRTGSSSTMIAHPSARVGVERSADQKIERRGRQMGAPPSRIVSHRQEKRSPQVPAESIPCALQDGCSSKGGRERNAWVALGMVATIRRPARARPDRRD